MKILKKASPGMVDSLVKIYPHKKITENVYLVMERPKNMPKLAKDYLINALDKILNLIVLPFSIIYELLKIFRLFLPMFLIKNKKD